MHLAPGQCQPAIRLGTRPGLEPGTPERGLQSRKVGKQLCHLGSAPRWLPARSAKLWPAFQHLQGLRWTALSTEGQNNLVCDSSLFLDKCSLHPLAPAHSLAPNAIILCLIMTFRNSVSGLAPCLSLGRGLLSQPSWC